MLCMISSPQERSKATFSGSNLKQNCHLGCLPLCFVCLPSLFSQQQPRMNSMPPRFTSAAASLTDTAPPCPTEATVLNSQGWKKGELFKKTTKIPNSLCPATVTLCRLYKTPSDASCLDYRGWCRHKPRLQLHLEVKEWTPHQSSARCFPPCWLT